MLGGTVPFSRLSYATSSMMRCIGSMPDASSAVMEKNGASKRLTSSFRKQPCFTLV